MRLLGFPRADAYVALYPVLQKLVLPMGVADLATNRPPTDIGLVALRATLVVRRDLHPALQLLLINAAEEIHGRPGIFHAAGAFPAADAIDLPISDSARQFYLNGPSFLQRNMPFWFGQILQRLLLVLARLLGILYPLSAGLPRLYCWQMQRRIYRLYGELKWIERELHDDPARHIRAIMTAGRGRKDAVPPRAGRAAARQLPQFASSRAASLKARLTDFISPSSAFFGWYLP